MNEFEKKVLAFCRKEKLFTPGDHVIVALSGGPDSVALLRCLLSLKDELSVSVAAAHLNHNIREAACVDQGFCEELCHSFGVPLFVKAADIPMISKERGESVETAGRQYRYDFFRETLTAQKADIIALAHHMDDQAETFLMHLLRGAGTEGLGGIRPLRDSIYARPFLGVTKAEILEYLNDLQQDFCVDETNASDEYFRNRIRLELIPSLCQYNPNIAGILSQTAEMLRDEHRFIQKEALAFLEKHEEAEGILSSAFLKLDKALQRQVLRESFLAAMQTMKDLSYPQIESARALIASGAPGRRLDFPGGAALVTSYNTFCWQKMEKAAYTEECFVLELNQSTKCDPFHAEFRLFAVSCAEYQKMTKEVLWEAFDAEILKKPIEVRAFEPGDRMAPFGMEGTKKVQDLFTDQKIPRFKRSEMPLVVQNERVLWIPGVRRSRDFLVSEHTKEVIIIQITGGKWHA